MVAVEATGAPLIPLFLSAASAARMDEEAAVRVAFRHAKKGLDALGSIFGSVYERCDTHIFRRRVRPFLVQSEVISDMELSDHFLSEDGFGTEVCHLCRAGFRAQPAVLAFLDTLFGFEERHAGSTLSSAQEAEAFHTKVAGPTLPLQLDQFQPQQVDNLRSFESRLALLTYRTSLIDEDTRK